jgi:hypothetical protein
MVHFTEALERAAACLSPDAPEEVCSVEVMEKSFKELSEEAVQSKCTPAQLMQTTDLWRLIKMIDNGATRHEALAARHPENIKCDAMAQAYGQVLSYLNPYSSKSLECSLDELELASRTLTSSDVYFTQAQNQVIDQLQRVIQDVQDGDSVQTAIKKVWESRDNQARARLLNARHNFCGMYPSGGAYEFERALEFLSAEFPDERCSLGAMESAFRVLDSELVRLECTDAHQEVIDDLWRLIKMIYSGATRQEALAARRPEEILDSDIWQKGRHIVQAYKKTLRYINPASFESANCSLGDLESACAALEAYGFRVKFSNAQKQVVYQLQKIIKLAKDGDSVQAAIRQAWSARDTAARVKLEKVQPISEQQGALGA